jgi:hypothetical protein
MIREIFEENPISGSIISILFLGIIFLLVDVFFSVPESFNGIVIDKHYKQEINTTGTGYGMTNNGQSGVIMTSQHESEKFLLMVKTESGQIFTVECSPELYYEKKLNQKINCNSYKGYFTKNIWSNYGVN